MRKAEKQPMERNDSAFLNLHFPYIFCSHVLYYKGHRPENMFFKDSSASLLFIPHLNNNLLFVPSQLVAMAVIMSLVSHFRITMAAEGIRIWFKEKVGPPLGWSKGPSLELHQELPKSEGFLWCIFKWRRLSRITSTDMEDKAYCHHRQGEQRASSDRGDGQNEHNTRLLLVRIMAWCPSFFF